MKRVVGKLLFFLLLIVIVGCSNEQSENANKENGKNSQDQVEIEYFQMKVEVVDVVNELIEEFEKQNPNIIVEQNNVPNPENVWTMRVSSDDAPDVFTHYPHNAVLQKMAKDGQVLDLTNDPLLKNIKPSILELSKIDGKNYLVPVGLATLGVYYNKDIFEEHNLEVPRTLDEFYDVLEKLKSAGVTPFYFHDKDANGIRQEVVYKLGQSFPDIENILDDVMNGKAHIQDFPRFREFAQSLLDLRQYGQEDMLGTDYNDALRDFALGKAAMWFTGIWAISEIKATNPDLNFALFPFPTEKEEDLKTQISVDTAIGLPVNGKNEEAARKFIEFMTTEESVKKYLSIANYPSAINNVDTAGPEITLLSELIDQDKVYPTIERLWPPGVNTEVGKATQELFITKDIDQYIQALDEAFYNKFNE